MGVKKYGQIYISEWKNANIKDINVYFRFDNIFIKDIVDSLKLIEHFNDIHNFHW